MFLRKLPRYERGLEAYRAIRPADASDLRGIAEYRGYANHHREQMLRCEDAMVVPRRSVTGPSSSQAPSETDLRDAARRWEQLLDSEGRLLVNP